VPIVDTMPKSSAVDQLVESFVADAIMYMLESMGPARADEFKMKHFGNSHNNKFANKTTNDFHSEIPKL